MEQKIGWNVSQLSCESVNLCQKLFVKHFNRLRELSTWMKMKTSEEKAALFWTISQLSKQHNVKSYFRQYLTFNL